MYKYVRSYERISLPKYWEKGTWAGGAKSALISLGALGPGDSGTLCGVSRAFVLALEMYFLLGNSGFLSIFFVAGNSFKFAASARR